MAFSTTRVLITSLAISVAGCAGPEAPESEVDTTAGAVADSAVQSDQAGPDLAVIAAGQHRAAENIARNRFRNPVETLEFFGLRADSTVMEIWPSGGWYTEVIAPYVNESGKYIAAHWDPDSDREFIRKGVERYQAKLDEYPDLYGNVEMAVLMHPEFLNPVPPDSVDLVVTFRNIHNWMAGGYENDMYRVIFEALKPGGVLGVVEHRGNPSVPQDPKAKSGYVNESAAIEQATRAGFALLDQSDINANPNDTKDYPKGVWTLPPTFREGDENRETYAAIGESDRFTLKFVKPRN